MIEIDVATKDFGEWGTVDPDREIDWIVGASLGVGDAVCGLIAFKDGTYEVGVGNPLRPYDQLYKGDSNELAAEAWHRWCHDYV